MQTRAEQAARRPAGAQHQRRPGLAGADRLHAAHDDRHDAARARPDRPGPEHRCGLRRPARRRSPPRSPRCATACSRWRTPTSRAGRCSAGSPPGRRPTTPTGAFVGPAGRPRSPAGCRTPRSCGSTSPGRRPSARRRRPVRRRGRIATDLTADSDGARRPPGRPRRGHGEDAVGGRRHRRRGRSRLERAAADQRRPLAARCSRSSPRPRTSTCPNTIMRLKMQQTGYQAALSATAKAISAHAPGLPALMTTSPLTPSAARSAPPAHAPARTPAAVQAAHPDRAAARASPATGTTCSSRPTPPGCCSGCSRWRRDGPRFLAVPAARVLPRVRPGAARRRAAPSSAWRTPRRGAAVLPGHRAGRRRRRGDGQPARPAGGATRTPSGPARSC